MCGPIRKVEYMEPLLCSRRVGCDLLSVGYTTLDTMVARGVIESVKIGNRRLLRLDSIRRIAGVEPDQHGEA